MSYHAADDIHTIFRFSLDSDAITSVAAMMLVSMAAFSSMIPLANTFRPFCFADVKVGVEKPHKTGKPAATLEPRKHITLLDLLAARSAGLTYDLAVEVLSKNSTRGRPYADSTTPNCVARLAKLPLRRQPGTCWITGHPRLLGR